MDLGNLEDWSRGALEIYEMQESMCVRQRCVAAGMSEVGRKGKFESLLNNRRRSISAGGSAAG